jgi:hypothetical protein
MMEVLTIIMIVSVMSTVIMQSGSSFYATEQAYATASMLVSDIRMARYRAIEHQCYIELEFSPYNDGWYVRELCEGGEPVTGEFTGTLPEWESILGTEMRDISMAVTMEFDPAMPAKVYFRPDGLLVTDYNFNAAPIGAFHVSFVYENSEDEEGAKITVTPSGVIESEAYYKVDY